MSNIIKKLKTRKFVKFTIWAFVGLGLSLAAADQVWKASGSGKWEIARQEQGLVVSTMKVPGDRLLKYKIDMTVDAKLSDVVYYMTDINTGADLGAIDLTRIEHAASDPVVINYDSYKIDLGSPFGMREVVIVNQYAQDPVTKAVEINILASPNKIPPTPGVKRIQELSNHWKMVPLENNTVAIEMISDINFKIPYVMSNLALTDVVFDTTSQMRELLKLDKFKNNSAAFVSELDENTTALN